MAAIVILNPNEYGSELCDSHISFQSSYPLACSPSIAYPRRKFTYQTRKSVLSNRASSRRRRTSSQGHRGTQHIAGEFFLPSASSADTLTSL